MKAVFFVLFCMFLLVPVVFASIGTGGGYNSETRFSFVGYNATGSGYQSRGSDQITGSFSIGTTYTGRLGILKYCGNSIIDSGETCDSANLNSQTCSTRGYSSGTLACNSDCSGFDTSGCTTAPTAPITPSPTARGSSSGASPSPTEFSSVTSVDVVKGGFAVFTTAQSASFASKGVNYIADVKQIGEDFVRIWVYYPPESTIQIEPIEAAISVGKRANIDLDRDSWADVSIELRGIKDGNAFLYLKELRAPSKVSMPTGQQVSVQEGFELPEITLAPKDLIPEKALSGWLQNFGMFLKGKVEQFRPGRVTSELKALVTEKSWLKPLQDFENVARSNVDRWISNIKTKKSWLLPSAAFIGLLLLFFERSLTFYVQKNRLKGKLKGLS